MDIWTTLAKFGALMFGLLILFPIVAAPLMFAGMAATAMTKGETEADVHPQGAEWKEQAAVART